jgi:hypothetical protein
MPALALSVQETATTDWFGVGLVASIVGGFLLANSILFRQPRDLIEQHFGGVPRRLAGIRTYIFHRLQVNLGFLFLLSGFGLQLYGHFRPLPDPLSWRSFPTAWVGAVLVTLVALELAGWWLSHVLFRHHVKAHFRENPPDLETNVALARELGELFGIESAGDDTVQAYLERLRRTLGLPQGRPSTVRRAGGALREARPAEEELV